jgi:hypothetical protein
VTGKFSAAAVQHDDCPKELRDLGKRIAAHLEKTHKYSEKANQHRIAAAQLLAQARELCDGGGFDAFHSKFFPNLGRSRTYELLAIATGKKSVEETKAGTRERVARYRVSRTQVSVTTADVTDDPGSREGEPAENQPFASGGEQSIEERRALMVALDGEPEPDSAVESEAVETTPDVIDSNNGAAAPVAAITPEKMAFALRHLPREDLMAVFDLFGVAALLKAASPEFKKQLQTKLVGKRKNIVNLHAETREERSAATRAQPRTGAGARRATAGRLTDRA